jgi:hypothetical protein
LDADLGRIAEAAPHQYGEKGAKITFPSSNLRSSGLQKKLSRPPPADATGLSVWVRGSDRPARFRVQFHQGQGPELVVWGVEKSVGSTEWVLVKVPFNELKHVFSTAASQKQPVPRFDQAKLNVVEIDQLDCRTPFSIFVDHFKWEVRK